MVSTISYAYILSFCSFLSPSRAASPLPLFFSFSLLHPRSLSLFLSFLSLLPLFPAVSLLSSSVSLVQLEVKLLLGDEDDGDVDRSKLSLLQFFLYSSLSLFFCFLCIFKSFSLPLFSLCFLHFSTSPPGSSLLGLSSGFYSQRMHALLRENSNGRRALAVKRSP